MMVKLPRLNVQGLGCGALAGIHGFEEAKNFPFGQCILVVEDHVIGSYEDLLRLVEQSEFKTREFLNVELLDLVAGG